MSERLALVLTELRRRKSKDKASISFPEQDAFVNDRGQFISALCTRRAGKTSGLARKFKLTMDRHPNSLCRYISLTRDSAKDIMWPILEEMDEREGWGAVFTESNLTMTLKNGARLKLYGADMKNFIRRLRGAKSPASAIDECQEFLPSHLEDLVDNILTPSIADYTDGWIGLGGTPGPIPRGYFYEITQEGKHGFSNHKWGLYQNPFMPDPEGFVKRLQEKKGWPDDFPTLQREYKGKWVLDTESLLIRYKEEKNNYDQLPHARWIYILGVDIGHRDADALALIAWSESLPDIYLVEEQTTRGQDITQLATQIESMMARYDIAKIVMDEGALGKKIAEEIRRRKHIPIQPADKARKMENVAFLNDYLRLGKFKAKKNSQFVQDSYQLQIDYEKTTPDRLVVRKGFHSDIIDAVLYAFKESPAFTWAAKIEPPKIGTPEWGKQEESEMEQAAIQHFEDIENSSKGFGI